MRKVVLPLVCILGFAAAAYLAYAQAEHQAQDKGYIEIGSYTETATKKQPAGSLYRGAGVLTYEGKPPKPFLQHDMGGYEVDPAPAADRNKPYDHRDLSHVWEFIAGNALGKTPPMTAAAKASRAAHITTGDIDRLHKPTNDPELTCDPMGYPRIVFRNTRAFEVYQLPTQTLFHHVWHETWQKIWMDGRLLPKPPYDPAWVGYSVGKWVGDTLVVDTNGVDERAWLDTGGLGHSLNAKFQSRWRRIDHNTLQFNLTIDDPSFYLGGPWNTPDSIYEIYPNLDLDILPCVPSEEFEYRNNSPTENPTPGTDTTIAQ